MLRRHLLSGKLHDFYSLTNSCESPSNIFYSTYTGNPVSVCGQLKEVIQILVAFGVFSEHLSAMQVLGGFVTLLAAEGYRRSKHSDGSADCNNIQNIPTSPRSEYELLPVLSKGETVSTQHCRLRR
jgi:hypothetical protein